MRPPITASKSADLSKLLPREYLLVTDKDSKILKSSLDYLELLRLANTIRRSGGEVTIFKSMKA